MSLRGLVLAGGHSQRMGQAKGLLSIGGATFVEMAYLKLSKFIDEVYISLRPEQLDSYVFLKDRGITILQDEILSAGPAAALLRAHQEFPEGDWFVLACDFALAHIEDVQQMKSEYDSRSEIICYQNSQNISEPLFAIWKSQALKKLVRNISLGHLGPQWTLQKCSRKKLNPKHSESLFNVNTPGDFNSLVDLSRSI